MEDTMAPSEQALKDPLCPAGTNADKRVAWPHTAPEASPTRRKLTACSSVSSYTSSSRAQYHDQDTEYLNGVSRIPRASVLKTLPKTTRSAAPSVSASASGLGERTSQILVGKADEVHNTQLPPPNAPPPDSNISQLWEEVKERLVEWGYRSETSISASSTTRVSLNIFYTLRRHGISDISMDLPANCSISTYLDVMSIVGEPQFARSYDETLILKYWKIRVSQLFDSINTLGPLVSTYEAMCSLEDTSRTQYFQPESRKLGSVPPTLSRLIFQAVMKSSDQFEKRSFGVNVQSTLTYIGKDINSVNWMPSSMMGPKHTGATFLHVLVARSNSTTSILAEWIEDAQEELLRQLRIRRIGGTNEDIFRLPSRLRHFGYLIEECTMEIWEMKVQTAPPDDKEDSTFEVGPSESLFSEETDSLKNLTPTISESSLPPEEVISDLLPRHVPCSCRRIGILDLGTVDGIKEFLHLNDAIMRWGQAKHGLDFMENMYRLIKPQHDDYDHWMMSAEVTKEFWRDIVAFRGP